MPPPVISVSGLGKRYLLSHQRRSDTLRDSLAQSFRGLFGGGKAANAEEFWALRDVSFEVRAGDVVGIIGRNGAGKSTLLKVLSRITEPTTGRATIRGRIASLLEVGTGFHPELSGRENVYLNGTILGMTKAEIDQKFDEIVDFSGVEKFLDTPIKRYSSGMKVRLAFAVAAHLEPEILIIDEVLAVGDAEFQNRCLGKMKDVARSGRTVLFVSHNMAAVLAFCSRGLWVDHGQIGWDGDIRTVAARYQQTSVSTTGTSEHRFYPTNDLRDTQVTGFHIHEFRITNDVGQDAAGFPTGTPLRFELRGESVTPLVAPVFLITVSTQLGTTVTELHSVKAGAAFPSRVSGPFTMSCVMSDIALMPGEYLIQLRVKQQNRWFFRAEQAGSLNILPTDFFSTGKLSENTDALVLARQQWQLEERAPTTCTNSYQGGTIHA
jgi:lipopolysaccharide transport system ATP-binding protein